MTKAAISCLHTLYAGIADANIDHWQGKAGKQAKEGEQESICASFPISRSKIL
jgi:hypothetical protein